MTFVGAVVGVLLGIILLVAVAIPVTVSVINNLTGVSTTTALIVGLLPLFLALGGIMLVVKLYQ